MAMATKVMAQLRKFLDDREWKYLQDGPEILRGLANGDNNQWHWNAQCCANGSFLGFYAYCPQRVPPHRLTAVAEYLTRANFGLLFGKFEMNWPEGQVRLHTVVPILPSGVSVKAMEHLVHFNGLLMDRYLPGLLAVAIGGAVPEVAIRAAEPEDSSPTVPAAEPDQGRMGRLFSNDN